MEDAPAQSVASNPISVLNLVKQVQYKAYVKLEAAFQPLGITAVQFRILTTIASHPGLCSADLARIYDVKPQSMIRQIAALEGNGLIERDASSANKRLLQLRVTGKGKHVHDQCHAAAQAVEQDILGALGQAQQDQLRSILQLLDDSMKRGGQAALAEFSDEYRRLGVQRV